MSSMPSFSITPNILLAAFAVLVVLRAILSLTPVVARSQGRSTHFAREGIDPFIYAAGAAWLLTMFVARTYYIPSGSMIPTLQVNDVLIVDKFEYRFHAPHEGDIVVFPPPIPTPDDFIKRVIGLPGDTFAISHGVVIRNGVPMTEPYIAQKPNYDLQIRDYGIYERDPMFDKTWRRLTPEEANIPPRAMWTAPNRIPPHCYFMMGDNRNDSEDSHAWGFAQDGGVFATGPRAGKHAGFTGRAVVIFWPVSHFRIL